MQTREEKHGGVPVEHPARRAAHNVEHVARSEPSLEWTEQIGDCDLGALTHEGTGDFLANDARGTLVIVNGIANARSRTSLLSSLKLLISVCRKVAASHGARVNRDHR
jgi:hypothetical protein